MTTDNNAAAKDWKSMTDAMKARTASVDWSKVDWSKLTAADIGVHMGPMMTEEQFREYQRRKGSAVHVIRNGGTAAPKKQ